MNPSVMMSFGASFSFVFRFSLRFFHLLERRQNLIKDWHDDEEDSALSTSLNFNFECVVNISYKSDALIKANERKGKKETKVELHAIAAAGKGREPGRWCK